MPRNPKQRRISPKELKKATGPARQRNNFIRRKELERRRALKKAEKDRAARDRVTKMLAQDPVLQALLTKPLSSRDAKGLSKENSEREKAIKNLLLGKMDQLTYHRWAERLGLEILRETPYFGFLRRKRK